MRILITGSGGREHALAHKLARSGGVGKIFIAPGNGGTESVGQNVPIAVDDIQGLVSFAKKENIDLVVPGPELPLTLGIVDAMGRAGIACFGPDQYCARLEGSKSFAKEVMRAANVPTAACGVFDNFEKARDFIEKSGAPLVVKADGLAAGKGVVVASNREEALKAAAAMLNDNSFGAAGRTIVVEERLSGEEVSILCLCDGETVRPLPSAQDHKAVFDNDQGPNTGGMGAYSPAPCIPDEELEKMADLVARPILAEMKKRGHPFKGILYAGLMLTPDGPKVLEYNVRFGDPECQPILMRMESDLAAHLLASVEGRLGGEGIQFTPKTALGVVLAASGYPGKYAKNLPVSGIEDAEAAGETLVFHGGTKRAADGLVSTGGRVLCATALGVDLADAKNKAYAALAKIRMPQGHYRKDIGDKGLKRINGSRKP